MLWTPLLWLLACGGEENPTSDGSDGTPGSSDTTDASAATGTADSSTAQPSTTTTTTTTTGEPGITTTSPTSSGDGSSSGGTTGGRTCEGELPAHWIDGVDCGDEPQVQVHAYDPDTWILRQSLCTSFEGPFMMLLFGSERALLLDTGDGGIPIADVVHGLVEDWSQAHGGAQIELIVANTHAHGDHTAGNDAFVGHANTTIVGVGEAAVREFFGIADWPDEIVPYDLGGRVLDIVPLPGHEKAHIAVFDRATGVVFTGDTLYPGRLYIADFPAYVASIGRLVDHLAGHEVCRVLGAHIEMTNTPGEDFEFMQPSHPNEHPLELDLTHLLELRDAVEAMAEPMIEVHDDFIVYPL
ncbi:MBL fold metallo-hydrolase [Nannocystis sp. SCPEA4]|uniref:MBL fold metallo-hydrolase n=1 Tax=Nannocystis sp. SCPEA4 TaxID=2996787 RepID=UPI00226EB604|nr:MBL fold metallo-hydrolase [Nannocystis sp. SCPEA4]MCY1061622.1 MBL fold metallo-hydrolase [Nannocystis sp. SCPEA4]